MDFKCQKNKYIEFAERQGWFLLYDHLIDSKSVISYLLSNGCSVLAYFDSNGEFLKLTDVSNSQTSVKTIDLEEDD